jgi:2-polyprenyl-3-methyl-5-hydroxy-6-metoxy-1,4-benzoquinol methylase
MEYTGERVIPAHDGKPAQGNYPIHELMYREFLVATVGKVVIDVACGCGHGAKMIAEHAEHVFGYDISPEAINFATLYNQAPNISYDVADIRSLPHTPQSVDTVISVEVFEHVLDIEQVISEVHRVLKPNGFWCFTTPNGERYPDHRIVPWHVRHYTKSTLQQLLAPHFRVHIRETGLEPDSSIHFGVPTFGNYSVFCLKNP